MTARLTIVGPRGDAFSVGHDELRALPDFARVRDISTLDPKKKGAAVALSALLPDDERKGAKWITLIAEGGRFSASLPLDAVIEEALIIYEEQGRPLSGERGGPFRFWVPGAAACNTAEVDRCANVKGLERIELSAEKGSDTRGKKYAERGC